MAIRQTSTSRTISRYSVVHYTQKEQFKKQENLVDLTNRTGDSVRGLNPTNRRTEAPTLPPLCMGPHSRP